MLLSREKINQSFCTALAYLICSTFLSQISLLPSTFFWQHIRFISLWQQFMVISFVLWQYFWMNSSVFSQIFWLSDSLIHHILILLFPIYFLPEYSIAFLAFFDTPLCSFLQIFSHFRKHLPVNLLHIEIIFCSLLIFLTILSFKWALCWKDLFGVYLFFQLSLLSYSFFFLMKFIIVTRRTYIFGKRWQKLIDLWCYSFAFLVC